MATGRITKRTVDAAPPGFLWDEELRGFGLKVTPAHAKSYIFQYRMGGRETHARRFTIGTHGSPWTPASARSEAERLSMLVKRGIDPREHQLQRRRDAVDLAFRPYAQRFLDRYVTAEWPASYGFAESILRLHVVPILADKPLPAITRSDMSAILDAVPNRKGALKRNVYAVVRRLFRWAVSRGDIERSPLEGFEAPSSPPSRDRVLSDEELAAVWQASTQLTYPFGPYFQLLILTGQRREEVAALAWEELNRDAAEWVLPAARAKNGRAHVVPLSSAVVAVLDRIGGAKWPQKGLVFTTTGSTPVSGYSKAKARLDRLIHEARQGEHGGRLIDELPAWRVHDLRRTLATGLQRLGVRFEVTEAVLNHVGGARGGVAGVYQRHNWADEKKSALASWSAHIEQILRPTDRSNVVRLRGARAEQ